MAYMTLDRLLSISAFILKQQILCEHQHVTGWRCKVVITVLKELEFSLFPSTLSNFKGKIDSALQFLHQNHRALRSAVRSSRQALVLPPRQSFPSIVLRGLVLA